MSKNKPNTDHNSRASVQVTNNFKYAADITVIHTYDTSDPETYTFKDVMPGTTSDADMAVTYDMGWGHYGHDYWMIEADVLDGPDKGHYVSGKAQCTLHGDDDGAIVPIVVGISEISVTGRDNHDTTSWSVRAAKS